MFKSLKIPLILIIVGSIVGYVLLPVLPKFEWEPPEVKFNNNTGYIGLNPFEISVVDNGAGLKSAMVYLSDDNTEILIANKNYDPGVNKDSIIVKIDKKMGIEEGNVRLRVVVEDYSLIRFFRGNAVNLEIPFNLDIQRPRIKELSGVQYITHGGSGFIIYRSSKDTKKSGIRIGDYFFPGYSGYFSDSTLYVCFFAYPYNLGDDEEISLYAVDLAGNDMSTPIFYELLKASYKERTLVISEEFILKKMLPFIEEQVDDPESKIQEIFLTVNNKMRRESNKKIEQITKQSTNLRFWSGKFQQLSNSKVIATFGDKRTYIVKGENIDQQYHLGYDLSVTRKYPVEAANDGIVVFVGEVDIYGDSVVVDHGLGVMSLYSHLSLTLVNEGDEVKKGSIIGRTGTTGFAIGDHLHFGIYIHGVPVRPLEWWDAKWIDEKIDSRIGFIGLRDTVND